MALTIMTIIVAAAGFLESGCDRSEITRAKPATASASASGPLLGGTALELSRNQLTAIRIEPVGIYPFAVKEKGIGNIDFNNNVYFDSHLSVPVFPSRQGTISKIFVELGDEVQKDQPLYAIDSPDLAGAESTLIRAAEKLKGISEERARADSVHLSNDELKQLESGQRTAEQALRAARKAVQAFGMRDDEIDQVIATGRIEPQLLVRSPIAGQVASVNATPGLLAQPGMAPAPCARWPTFPPSGCSLKFPKATVPGFAWGSR